VRYFGGSEEEGGIWKPRLVERHYGPGDHPSGSPQSVHGGDSKVARIAQSLQKHARHGYAITLDVLDQVREGRGWLAPDGTFTMNWGPHDISAQEALDDAGIEYKAGDLGPQYKLISMGFARLIFNAKTVALGSKNLTYAQARFMAFLLDKDGSRPIYVDRFNEEGRRLADIGEGNGRIILEEMIDQGYRLVGRTWVSRHYGPGPHPSGSPQAVHAPLKTSGAKIEFGFAGIREGFQITTPKGARASGYLSGADFPGQKAKQTRGELFYVEVPEKDRRQGIGTSLVLDALRVMIESGTKTVNMDATTKEGQALIDYLIDAGYISGPIQESETGKAEYDIVVDAIVERHYGPGPHPSGSDQSVHSGGGKRAIGITSAREGKLSKQVFADMRAFQERLEEIKSLSNISVKPGVGGWEGGRESTWLVSFRGNGEATSLIAETAKRHDQDGVLLLEPCGDKGDCSPIVDWHFTDPVT
ncbi:hypothetical protein LCGC14_2576500, partial [marine sediment metagenome]